MVSEIQYFVLCGFWLQQPQCEDFVCSQYELGMHPDIPDAVCQSGNSDF